MATTTRDPAHDTPGRAARAEAARPALVDERWELFHRWGPLALLAFGTLLAVPTTGLVGMGHGTWSLAVGLLAAAVALQAWWIAAARSRPGPSAAGTAYYFLRWALAFTLAWLNPFFVFYAVTGYFGSERLVLRRFVPTGLLVTAVTMAGAQAGGFPPHGRVAWVVFGALIAVNVGLLAFFGHLAAKEEERSRVQAVTIDELERTNAALQQALDENAALHAQLLLQAREAGVADERRRLAAEIHDTIAQGLTGIIAQLQVVTNTPDPRAARTHLDRAADLARHSLGEARRSVHNLAPAALEHDALPEALDKTVRGWAERTGVRADFTRTGTAEPLHDEVEATLLRIAEEALANAARHAAATRVGVTLSYMAGEITLDVRDDGRGFDPRALPARGRAGGFGLDGMRARAERIAGALTVESEPGGGTAVSARVPWVGAVPARVPLAHDDR
ncbi:sensor histidine kinase [Streptomyces spectabilis]|uniref:Sensor histidine kinase n=1 Tax=Streptomyces spectabilis TaxID=68270 RepID=A0A5P2XPR6_STRST|nr:sensor histidine kinase [Streptomyces spectabilis]MBB5104384.1 signal transduction histidine kinase [Streptomyces spectabilis]MCI3905259.1 sensor histidine kinase [Streptomyces spectabilis]QEV64960.1 sensor histidine kinase [Streptomyces spectabilis]